MEFAVYFKNVAGMVLFMVVGELSLRSGECWIRRNYGQVPAVIGEEPEEATTVVITAPGGIEMEAGLDAGDIPAMVFDHLAGKVYEKVKFDILVRVACGIQLREGRQYKDTREMLAYEDLDLTSLTLASCALVCFVDQDPVLALGVVRARARELFC